jgi:quercetin dioxygenase-like cupin family protein
MAKKGDVMINKLTGDIVEFLNTSADTGGRFTKIKFTIKPGGFKAVEHLHPQFDETFNILSGKLTYILAGEKHIIEAGSRITLPKGIRHSHFNNEKEDLVMEQTFSPSLDVEVFLENLFGLTADGRFKNGSPEFLQLVMWQKKLNAKTYLAAIPVRAQKILSYILAPLGSILGYKASYAKYSGIEI